MINIEKVSIGEHKYLLQLRPSVIISIVNFYKHGYATNKI